MQIRGYNILGDIGQGGMATVYEAMQLSLNRRVALKVLAPALVADNEFCQRFLKEGKIVAQLSHPNIITIYDIGFSESSYFMSMEYLEGGNLRARIEQGLSENETIEIVLQVAAALGYAHDSGFLHRDVKPHNVLFRSDGSAVLSDFGIAKYLGDAKNVTQTGKTLGSPLYMSPEQIREEPLDIRTDLYSLGIVLYQMLTGFAPYLATTADSTTRMHLTCPLPKLPEHLGRFQPIIRRLLAKSRTNRFQNAWELIDALQALPISDTDGSFRGQLQDTAQRRSQVGASTTGKLASTQRLSKSLSLNEPLVRANAASALEKPPEIRRVPKVAPVASKAESTAQRSTSRSSMVPRLVAGVAMLGTLAAVLLIAKQSEPTDAELAENIPLNNTPAVDAVSTAPTGPLISLTDSKAEVPVSDESPPLAQIPDSEIIEDVADRGQLDIDVVEETLEQNSVSLAQAQLQAAQRRLEEQRNATMSASRGNVEALDQVAGLNGEPLNDTDLADILEEPASMSKSPMLDIESARQRLAVLADPGIEIVDQQLEVTVDFERSLRQIIPQVYRDNLGQLTIDIDQQDLFQMGSDLLEDHGSLSLDRLSYVLRNYNGFAVGISVDEEPESIVGAMSVGRLRAERVKQHLIDAIGKPDRVALSDQARNFVNQGEGSIHLLIIPKL